MLQADMQQGIAVQLATQPEVVEDAAAGVNASGSERGALGDGGPQCEVHRLLRGIRDLVHALDGVAERCVEPRPGEAPGEHAAGTG